MKIAFVKCDVQFFNRNVLFYQTRVLQFISFIEAIDGAASDSALGKIMHLDGEWCFFKQHTAI